SHLRKFTKGTIIHFDGMNGGIKNTLRYIRKIVALYFRFSLLDKGFNIFIDGKKVSINDLKDTGEKTQFLWNINVFSDPFIDKCLKSLKSSKSLSSNMAIKGFVATVDKPSSL